MTVQTLQNYKMLADMIPELDELVTTGIVTKTTDTIIQQNVALSTQTTNFPMLVVKILPKISEHTFDFTIDNRKLIFYTIPYRQQKDPSSNGVGAPSDRSSTYTQIHKRMI